MNMKTIKRIVGLFLLGSLCLASCKQESVTPQKDTLSVEPSAAISFKAKSNPDVVLTVTTTAKEWDFKAPEWIVATKEGNTLKVNAKDNANIDSNAGRISFTAGNAKTINIIVTQDGMEGGSDTPVGGKPCSIVDESGENEAKIVIGKENTATAKLVFKLEETLVDDAEITVSIDESYLKEYNYSHNTNGVILPDAITPSFPQTLAIKSGETEASIEITFNGAVLEYSTLYLLPLKAEVKSGNIAFNTNASRRVNYAVTRKNPKSVRQLVCFEFNDVNPLNVLEYKLEDGSYFFDAVVLFSGNIGWYPEEQAVRFNKRQNEPVINRNTDALVKEWQTYIKPIHDAGIKVYMGIMPHHTAAGITNLSYNGCKWFAEEMAQIVKDCSMDGVFLDNEYVGSHGGPMTEEWSKPIAGGSYFAYQMKKQMAAIVPWPTDVAIYTYSLSASTVTDHETGEKVTPAKYADLMIGDYGWTEYPVEDQTKQNCSCMSLELNRGTGSISEDRARSWKEQGYGWCMWFAFNPDPNHYLYNLPSSMSKFQQAAKGFYDQGVQQPTHYYKKIGEGKYDPTRYQF